ncbi:hypothetical protein HU200_058887 [Digitaria exilis]|uniref:Uncharacterized protein n=1 Tax=Digitaria exilis TaxID=1010633 RepID=A0A835E3P4_9POAL|nr:hypothetical protein HU200_058887 [Digitaria exilis]
MRSCCMSVDKMFLGTATDGRNIWLNISIEYLFSKKAQKKIPVLSVIDDGHGMTYSDMMRMISFGHKRPNEHREDEIGRFGIGFKVLYPDYDLLGYFDEDACHLHIECPEPCVPLDYSLQSYLEVMFLNPRMKIYMSRVFGNILVKSRPWQRLLTRTSVISGEIMGRDYRIDPGKEASLTNGLEAKSIVADVGRESWSCRYLKSHCSFKYPCFPILCWICKDCVNVCQNWRSGLVGEWHDTGMQNFDNLELFTFLSREGDERHKPDAHWFMLQRRKWRVLNAGFKIDTLPENGLYQAIMK